MRDWRDERIEQLEADLAQEKRWVQEHEAKNAEQERRLAELEQQLAAALKQLADLSAKVVQNSRNSHRPPSSDSPADRKRRNKKQKSKRPRGAQQGHEGAQRELVPPEKVNKFVDLYPSHCENCWKALPKVPDPSAKRHQQTEIPPVDPYTTEWRRHAVKCPDCGYTTRAAHDPEVIPSSPFGPRLMAIIATLTGIYHLSRRKTVELLADLLRIRVSLGAVSTVEARVSTAVQPTVDEAWHRVGQAEVKHTDGTSWYQAGVMMALWTITTAVATVFKIVPDGAKATLKPLYGTLVGILVSDRAKALNFWAMDRRQICWAHLLRRFVAFSERDGPAGVFGQQLLDYTALLFQYWHDYKSGKLDHATLIAWMAPIRQQVETLLAQAVAAGIAGVSGSCSDILKHEAALWTFVEHDGVEPTNNAAEREIRAFVLWRKRSFGTQSARGNAFAENLMTVAHTARKQGKNVLAFLTECCEAHADKRTPPSLFDRESAGAT